MQVHFGAKGKKVRLTKTELKQLTQAADLCQQLAEVLGDGALAASADALRGTVKRFGPEDRPLFDKPKEDNLKLSSATAF